MCVHSNSESLFPFRFSLFFHEHDWDGSDCTCLIIHSFWNITSMNNPKDQEHSSNDSLGITVAREETTKLQYGWV